MQGIRKKKRYQVDYQYQLKTSRGNIPANDSPRGSFMRASGKATTTSKQKAIKIVRDSLPTRIMFAFKVKEIK